MSNLERIQVVGRRKCRQIKAVPVFSSERDGGVKIMVKSDIKDLNRIGKGMCIKVCAA